MLPVLSGPAPHSSVSHQWGPEISNDPELRDRAHFEPWALGGTDNHEEHDNPKYWTLDSLMKLNGSYSPSPILHCGTNVVPLLGHTFIDVLKIDIEGGEFDTLTAFVAAHAQGDLPIGQLQLEIHAQNDRGRFDYFVKWWEALEAAGLRPFWMEPNLVYVNMWRGARPDLAEVSLFHLLLRYANIRPGISSLASTPL